MEVPVTITGTASTISVSGLSAKGVNLIITVGNGELGLPVFPLTVVYNGTEK
jgi:hypothetical protein